MIANHAESIASSRKRQQFVCDRHDHDRDLAARVIDHGYRSMAKSLHPNRGGSHEDMIALNAMQDELRRRVA